MRYKKGWERRTDAEVRQEYLNGRNKAGMDEK